MCKGSLASHRVFQQVLMRRCGEGHYGSVQGRLAAAAKNSINALAYSCGNRVTLYLVYFLKPRELPQSSV